MPRSRNKIQREEHSAQHHQRSQRHHDVGSLLEVLAAACKGIQARETEPHLLGAEQFHEGAVHQFMKHHVQHGAAHKRGQRRQAREDREGRHQQKTRQEHHRRNGNGQPVHQQGQLRVLLQVDAQYLPVFPRQFLNAVLAHVSLPFRPSQTQLFKLRRHVYVFVHHVKNFPVAAEGAAAKIHFVHV